jgi:DNA-binding transcriptional regulator YdaS (Cro superfamily)
MTTEEAIQHFGGRKALADALGVWPQVIYQWGERPPMGRQYELEVRTSGVLKADREEASR